jgi:hypothetical protein
LTRVKKVLTSWEKIFNVKAIAQLLEIESQIMALLIRRSVAPLSESEESSLSDLLLRKKQLLEYEETQWILKSRDIWLKEGHNNSKFFHKYASYRKIMNSILEIKDYLGSLVSSFEGIANAGKE